MKILFLRRRIGKYSLSLLFFFTFLFLDINYTFLLLDFSKLPLSFLSLLFLFFPTSCSYFHLSFSEELFLTRLKRLNWKNIFAQQDNFIYFIVLSSLLFSSTLWFQPFPKNVCDVYYSSIIYSSDIISIIYYYCVCSLSSYYLCVFHSIFTTKEAKQREKSIYDSECWSWPWWCIRFSF